MKTIGIISEYNPFHNGHQLHIERSREQIGQKCAIVCVMSGDFVQRGEAAIFSKYSRAEAAVHGGADLVFELPLPWVLSSAEGFARGAVGLLGSLGCIDYLSFGSECGEIAPLNALAMALIDSNIIPAVKQEMKSGISFASARQIVMEREYGSVAKLLESPNNTLGVEYLKALFDQHLKIEPLTVLREGAAHDEPGGSASDVRIKLENGKKIKEHVPKAANKILKREMKNGRGPVTMSKLEPMVLSRLRMLGEDAYNNLPDASEGLGGRLFAAAHSEPEIDAILAAAKTKRYAMSRIRRMCMCAALGVEAWHSEGTPPYARVLAANERGREALRVISQRSAIPVITKPASVKELAPECLTLFTLESLAHDFYVLGYPAIEERRGGGDFRATPVMIK